MSHKDIETLTVMVFGETQYAEDEPCLGTFWRSTCLALGQSRGIPAAIALAEHCVSIQDFDLRSVPGALRFSPKRILVQDFACRPVLGGEVAAEAIDWLMPATSDDEVRRLRQQIGDLRAEAATEIGWDNYSTGRGLRDRAHLLEARLVDATWREAAIGALKCRSLENPRARH